MEHASCYTPQCTQREHCTLWHNALVEVEHSNSLLTITNPQLIERAGGYDHCPNYHEHKLRRYARRLVWRYDDMTLGQKRQIESQLNAHFGKNAVIRMRCGYEAISPEEQGFIAETFAAYAPAVEPQYVTYEEHYTKPPRIEGRAAHKLLKS